MPINVLLVDDSNFFQHRLQEILAECPDLKVVGVAGNGREAVSMARQLRPDVITMDYEMPIILETAVGREKDVQDIDVNGRFEKLVVTLLVIRAYSIFPGALRACAYFREPTAVSRIMDGVTAVRQIMADRSTPILMFSSLTYEGARITLDALDAGAVVFLPKSFAEVSGNATALKEKLHQRIVALSRAKNLPAVASGRVAAAGGAWSDIAAAPAAVAAARLKGRVKLLLLVASTGGPVALTEIFSRLPANFPLPIVLVQHMPENFTRPFAERLDQQSRIRVREAEDGDSLVAGTALVAPGGKQLMIDSRARVSILAADERVNYKPSLDITFGSAANAFADAVLAVVLTGMGADGCEGARLIKQQGGVVWSQDEASCVVYGMPLAVVRERLSDRVLSLGDIGPMLVGEL